MNKLLRILAVLGLLGSMVFIALPAKVGATTITLAASNSSSGDKASATAVCDGAYDQVEINAYLTTGNTVELYAGTYNCDSTITPESTTHLYGQGNTSIINLQDTGINISNVNNVEIDHIKITGTVNTSYINSAIWIGTNMATTSNINIHDITCDSTGSDDIDILSYNARAVDTITFSNITLTNPSGFGFCLLGSANTANTISNVIFYNCNVTNAGYGGGSEWATGFNFDEAADNPTQLTVSNVYVIDCSVNGAWETDFHMENAFTCNNFVFTGNSAINAGQKTPTPLYGFGYLLNGDVVEYGNTASSNVGGDLYINGTTYTPIVDAISPANSTKTASTISSGNCGGVVIDEGSNNYEIVAYTKDGNPVNQNITIAGHSVNLNFTDYLVEIYNPPPLPTVVTDSSSSVTINSASVHEEVTDIGTSDVTAWGTNYGTSTGYGLNSNNSGDKSGGFSWDDSLGSLTAATLYHYRGYATNSAGTGYGTDATFLTLPNAPTSLGKTVGDTQVAFTWTKANGGSGTTIYTRIQYSASSYPSSYTDGTTGVAWTTGSVGTVTGLTNGTLYYFSVFTKAVNGSLTEYSTASAQTTATPVGTTTTTTTTGTTTTGTTTTTTTTTSSIVAPTVSLTGASLITDTTARISGIVSNTGGENPTVIVFWDTTNKYQGVWANGDYPTSPSQPQGQVSFYYDVTGLTASTTYYYTATGTNSAGTAWTSPSLHFTTTGGTTTTTTTSQTTVPIPTNATGVINWIPLFFAAGIVFLIVMMAKNSNQSNMIQVVIEIAILITVGLIILAQVNSAIHL